MCVHLATTATEIGDRIIQRCALCGHLLRDNYRDPHEPGEDFFCFEPGTWVSITADFEKGVNKYTIVDLTSYSAVEEPITHIMAPDLPLEGAELICTEFVMKGDKNV